MRRGWGLGARLLCAVVAVAPAAALGQGDVTDGTPPPAPDTAAPAQAIGYAAMPGGLHSPSAESLPKGQIAVASLGGFGWREGLLGDNHRFGRGIGNLAFAFGAHDLVTIGLSLDGRYDRHFGLAPSGDDGYVGDPHLIARVSKPQGNLRFGAQLGIWVPGKDAPSVAASAISVDARALLALNAGPGLLSFSAGFRLDNSSRSADDPMSLSAQDRVSLGVSEFNAALASVHLGLPFGKAFVNLESSIDVFVGSGETPAGATEAHSAPSPVVRFGASLGYHVTKTVSVLAFVESAIVPSVDETELAANDIKLVAYEPFVTGGIGVQLRFGGPQGPAGSIVTNTRPEDVELPVTAELSGVILDDAGKPVVGAKVDIRLKKVTGTGVTDDKGEWKVEKLPIGRSVKGVITLDDDAAEISVDVSGKKPAKIALKLQAGTNAVERITLDPVLPPGELRGLVRSLVTGKALAGAAISIEPGGLKTTSGADGSFSIELQPGQYKVKVSSPGLATQELDVTIAPNGVAIQGIELHR